jgi:hypothetical protein
MPEPSPELVRLQDAVLAVDRLNSWVRSESYRNRGAGKEFIYFLKRQSLKALDAWSISHAQDEEWENRLYLSHSIVVVPSVCRTCGGDGIWRDWESDATGPCRNCRQTGQRVLTFVETTASVGWICRRVLIAWHTPPDDWPLTRPDCWPSETRWRPNQKGADLTPAEVAAALNIAEVYFPDRPGRRWTRDGYEYDPAKYSLDVGETERRCHFCGTEGSEGNVITRYGCSRHGVCWSDHACRECRDKSDRRNPGKAAIFDEFAFPAALASDPAIVAWRERHAIAAAVKKTED